MKGRQYMLAGLSPACIDDIADETPELNNKALPFESKSAGTEVSAGLIKAKKPEVQVNTPERRIIAQDDEDLLAGARGWDLQLRADLEALLQVVRGPLFVAIVALLAVLLVCVAIISACIAAVIISSFAIALVKVLAIIVPSVRTLALAVGVVTLWKFILVPRLLNVEGQLV